jgi:membrane protein required for beta-lactamase induction
MDAEPHTSSRSLGRTAVAVIVLLIAAWFVLHFLLGILSFLFSSLLLVLVVVGVIWALSVLL